MKTLYVKSVLPGLFESFGTSWLPIMPDFRDYTEDLCKTSPFPMAIGTFPKGIFEE